MMDFFSECNRLNNEQSLRFLTSHFSPKVLSLQHLELSSLVISQKSPVLLLLRSSVLLSVVQKTVHPWYIPFTVISYTHWIPPQCAVLHGQLQSHERPTSAWFMIKAMLQCSPSMENCCTSWSTKIIYKQVFYSHWTPCCCPLTLWLFQKPIVLP